MNKFIIILTTAILLGGCTLGSKMTKKSEINSTPDASPTSSVFPDTDLDSLPATTTSSDISSIEQDLNTTVILEEDFSDLE
ncbi:MAG: hypothetical protein Fur0011_0920 [Candidatus Microgenomates bacterium]